MAAWVRRIWWYDTKKARTGSTMAPRCCQTNLPECVSGDLASAPAWDSSFTMISLLNVDVFHTRHLNHDNFVLCRPWQPIPREQLQCSQSLVAVGNPKILGILGATTTTLCRSMTMESALQLIKSANAMTPQASDFELESISRMSVRFENSDAHWQTAEECGLGKLWKAQSFLQHT